MMKLKIIIIFIKEIKKKIRNQNNEYEIKKHNIINFIKRSICNF